MFINDKEMPIVMGILNCTPDSFSDGGQFIDVDTAFQHALQMQSEGAKIIDIGGESTRPGATLVSADEELSRIVPVIEKLLTYSDVKISVDTSKPLVMEHVLNMGVSMINDVNGLEAKGAIEIVAKASCDVCLMHKKGMPQSMQQSPSYQNVVNEVYQYLSHRTQACLNSGVEHQNIMIDVGIGFGKTVSHNLSLLKNLDKFSALGFTILAGVSRKSVVGAVLNRTESLRVEGSIALAVIAYLNGARIFRVHDVRQTNDALLMAQAVNQAI